MTGKIRVAVLFGGPSGEHEVSLVSAKSVMEALNREKYETIAVGITKEGQWLTGGNPLETLKLKSIPRLTEHSFISPDPAMKGITVLTSGNGKGYQYNRTIPVDVVFPVLHGPYGEDGKIQGLFEMADLPYVGAGVLASACGMDKVIMKELFSGSGLPVARGMTLMRKNWQEKRTAVIEEIERELGYPVFIKPSNLGSSVGISKAHGQPDLIKGIDEACNFDRKILIEAAVLHAREIECSVLGNEDPKASVPGEIIPCNEFYDYEAKYVAGKSQTLAPADLPGETIERVRNMAIRAYRALDCEGMARVDFLLNGQTGELFVNELNTIPGFTSISMYPKLWEATGLPFGELIDRLIDLALERQKDKERTRKGITLENDWYRR
jgi:D-alanine-D-alanine ligase